MHKAQRSTCSWPGFASADRPGLPGRELTWSCGCEPTDATGMPTSASAAAPCSSRSRSARAVPYEQSGWRYRVIQDGPELVLQTGQDAEWVDLYGFVPDPVPFIDVETSNWFTSTHPRSPFVTGLIVADQRPDGTRLTLSDWEGLSLTEETPAGASVRPVEAGEVDELIAGRFGLDGGDG